MSRQKARLLSLIRERAYVAGEVTLASGQTSSFYIDGKMIELSPEGAHLVGEVLLDEIEATDDDIQAVGGLATGAVPLVTSLVISCHHRGREIEGFFVREEPKSHGTKKVIEGCLPDHARVIIVDDVVTSGKSVMKAVRAAEERRATVAGILSIVDRDAGASEFFREQGYPYRYVFSKAEILEYAHA